MSPQRFPVCRVFWRDSRTAIGRIALIHLSALSRLPHRIIGSHGFIHISTVMAGGRGFSRPLISSAQRRVDTDSGWYRDGLRDGPQTTWPRSPRPTPTPAMMAVAPATL